MTDLRLLALQLLRQYWWPVTVVIATSSIGLVRVYWPKLWAWVPYRLQWAPAALLSLLSMAVDYAANGASPAATWQYVVASFFAMIGLAHTAPRVSGKPSAMVDRRIAVLKALTERIARESLSPPEPTDQKPPAT